MKCSAKTCTQNRFYTSVASSKLCRESSVGCKWWLPQPTKTNVSQLASLYFLFTSFSIHECTRWSGFPLSQYCGGRHVVRCRGSKELLLFPTPAYRYLWRCTLTTTAPIKALLSLTECKLKPKTSCCYSQRYCPPYRSARLPESSLFACRFYCIHCQLFYPFLNCLCIGCLWLRQAPQCKCHSRWSSIKYNHFPSLLASPNCMWR